MNCVFILSRYLLCFPSHARIAMCSKGRVLLMFTRADTNSLSYGRVQTHVAGLFCWCLDPNPQRCTDTKLLPRVCRFSSFLFPPFNLCHFAQAVLLFSSSGFMYCSASFKRSSPARVVVKTFRKEATATSWTYSEAER